MKTCSACGEEKPEGEFWKGRHACKACTRKGGRPADAPKGPDIVFFPFWPDPGKFAHPGKASPPRTVKAGPGPRKGRCGTDNPGARLSGAQRAAILSRLARGDKAFDVAADYSVAPSTVYRIGYRQKKEESK